MPDRMWAITSYFNPAGYRRRRRNYRVFRDQLNVPLVAVELSYTGEFELCRDDAEVLIQVRGSDVLWQKERLLNVALSGVPAECRHVAWLDCDIVFERPDWAGAASAILDELPLCQLFRAVYHLAPEARTMKDHAVASHKSFGWALAHSATPQPECVFTNDGFQRGHAWAARRSLLESVGLYDRGIIGGGDKLMAFAAIGRARDVIGQQLYSRAYVADYLEWANAFYGRVLGRVGFVDADLFHLWHGDIRDRRYSKRQSILADHDYDPRTDIALDEAGCWRWNSPKPEMHRRVREYFHSRMEDGRAMTQAAD
jgi:hypothetical protein